MVYYLTLTQQIEAVNIWQKYDAVQTFLCEKNIKHGRMDVCTKGDIVYLYCRHCGHIEMNIPEVVFQKYFLLKNLV